MDGLLALMLAPVAALVILAAGWFLSSRAPPILMQFCLGFAGITLIAIGAMIILTDWDAGRTFKATHSRFRGHRWRLNTLVISNTMKCGTGYAWPRLQ